MRYLTVVFIFSCLLCPVGGFLSTGTLAAEKFLEGSRPNVILIITDDQGYAPIGRHGHPWIRTPHLNALYDKSTRLRRFLVSPTCSPTRAALMTGRHPMQNGVTHTIFERERMALDAVTLAELLQRSGYQTGIFGKWHLGDEEPYQPHRRGFSEAFIHGAGGIGQAYDCSCADAPGNSYHNPVIRHNGKFVKTQGFCTDVFFLAALGWINQARDREEPFFAYIATNAPHGPFIAPEKNRKRFERLGFKKNHAGYYGMIENIDENIGLLAKKLGDWNLLNDTCIIFMSDNGMAGSGAGGPGKQLGVQPDGTPLRCFNAGMKGLKGSTDEGGVRVPFFIRWDGHITADRNLDFPAAHIDVFPTLASLAGIAVPIEQVEGKNLLPFLKQGSPPPRYLFTHRGRWPVGTNPDTCQWKHFAVRGSRFRLVGKDALYDIIRDPSQTENVIGVHRAEADRMLLAYDAWWKMTREKMVNEGVSLSSIRPFHQRYAEQKKAEGIPMWQDPSIDR
ncbi:MAG: arylsulfatase [Planctomycetaceae bacterium]|nr:arylsulfatase [Planctomycetaceae bacterium]